MITVRPAEERGQARLGWLDSQHSFSFGHYYDPQQMGFGPLRVINEDRVSPGGGFDTHGHRDMEIISYVIEGALAHKDSMGNGSVIKPGDVQRMSAGRGVTHSEFNASKTEPVHFLQIWIVPERGGLPSGYEQKFFGEDDKRGKLRLIASPDGAEGSVTIRQDTRLYAAVLENGTVVSHTIGAQRKGWLHVVTGSAELNGRALAAGDGVAIDGSERLEIRAPANEKGEVLLFDMTA